jgi:YD repeat-containing protein
MVTMKLGTTLNMPATDLSTSHWWHQFTTQHGTPGRYFSGKLDECSFYKNYKLTASDVSTLYNAGAGREIGGIALQDFNYTYDKVGNITTLNDSSASDSRKTVAFGYDELNRLTTASTTSASSTPYTYSYTYDLLGNITQGGTNRGTTYAYPATNLLNYDAVSSIGTNGATTTYAYDLNGNLTRYIASPTTTMLTYDYQNRITQAAIGAAGATTTTTYGYDAFGSRIYQSTGTATSPGDCALRGGYGGTLIP